MLRLGEVGEGLVSPRGARCVGGSSGGLYLSPATSAVNASRLVVYIEGGGECRTVRLCASFVVRGRCTRVQDDRAIDVEPTSHLLQARVGGQRCPLLLAEC